MRSKLSFLLVLSLVLPSGAWAEPERAPSAAEMQRSAGKARKGKTRKGKARKGKTRKGKNARGKSSGASRGCKLKAMSKVRRLKIDPAIKTLFAKSVVNDGTISPHFRTSCCRESTDTLVCSPDSVGEGDHRCYKSRTPSDFNEITRRTGIKVGASPYSDGSYKKYERYEREGKNIKLVLTSNDLDAARWEKKYANLMYIQTWDDSHARLLADPEKLARHIYKHRGRIAQLSYNESSNNDLSVVFAGGADQDEDPLTGKGRALVGALFDQYILVDVSHVGTQSALEILTEAYERGRPITANHANAIGVYDDNYRSDDCRGGCKSRNHTDAVICGIAKSGGVVGATPIRFMMAPTIANEYQPATENDFLEHVDYMAKRLTCFNQAGKKIDMTKHVGLGSDSKVNGYAPKVGWLHMKTGSRLNRWKRVATRLKNECGYSLSEIERIVGGNLNRVYRRALPGLRRPALKRPRNDSVQRSKKVIFEWRRPKVNKPKWQPNWETTITGAKAFEVVIHRKKGGTFSKYITVKAGNKTKKTIKLNPGTYRWYVRAEGSQPVNSVWREFVRR